MPAFTVFTGTFNSEKVIHRLFDSVKHQTYKDFEWLIIDDCSNDNTVPLIEDFCGQNPTIDVKLVKHTTNTGIAISRKEALSLAEGTYFVTWDHDDEQSHRQLEIYDQLWKEYGKPEIANIFAKMKDQHGNLLGILFPQDPYLSDYIRLHNRYLRGNKSRGRVVEHHVCVKTAHYLEVLNYYEQHPELTDGRNPNGGDIWGMVAYLGYQTICTNTVVRKYYINEPGRQSMSSAKRKDGAKRILYNKLLWVNYFDPRLPFSEIGVKLRNVFAVAMYSYMSQQSFVQAMSSIKYFWAKVAFTFLYIPATFLGKKFFN